MSSPVAARPSSCRGWRTDDRGTAAAAAKSMSSYPTIATSSGTVMDLRVISCSTPSASGSLAQKMAVGRCAADISAIFAAAARPAATVNAGVSTTARLAGSRPARESARRAPS